MTIEKFIEIDKVYSKLKSHKRHLKEMTERVKEDFKHLKPESVAIITEKVTEDCLERIKELEDEFASL